MKMDAESAMQSTLESVLPLLKQATAEHKDIEITADSHLYNDLGFDSIGFLTFAFFLEEKFDIDVASHAVAFSEIATVGDIVKFIESITTA